MGTRTIVAGIVAALVVIGAAVTTAVLVTMPQSGGAYSQPPALPYKAGTTGPLVSPAVSGVVGPGTYKSTDIPGTWQVYRGSDETCTVTITETNGNTITVHYYFVAVPIRPMTITLHGSCTYERIQ